MVCVTKKAYTLSMTKETDEMIGLLKEIRDSEKQVASAIVGERDAAERTARTKSRALLIRILFYVLVLGMSAFSLAYYYRTVSNILP
jgi:hypothetical protein